MLADQKIVPEISLLSYRMNSTHKSAMMGICICWYWTQYLKVWKEILLIWIEQGVIFYNLHTFAGCKLQRSIIVSSSKCRITSCQTEEHHISTQPRKEEHIDTYSLRNCSANVCQLISWINSITTLLISYRNCSYNVYIGRYGKQAYKSCNSYSIQSGTISARFVLIAVQSLLSYTW
jgi:hypothetical protein